MLFHLTIGIPIVRVWVPWRRCVLQSERLCPHLCLCRKLNDAGTICVSSRQAGAESPMHMTTCAFGAVVVALLTLPSVPMPRSVGGSDTSRVPCLAELGILPADAWNTPAWSLSASVRYLIFPSFSRDAVPRSKISLLCSRGKPVQCLSRHLREGHASFSQGRAGNVRMTCELLRMPAMPGRRHCLSLLPPWPT